MKRNATASWKGTIKEGQGTLSTQSTVLDNAQYSFKTRFEDGAGTNPEELLAAAHAGCFTMMASALLSEAGHNPEKLDTKCDITLENGKITKSELSIVAKVSGLSDDDFQKIVQKAKNECPVSNAFSFEKTLISAKLEN